MNTFLNEAAFGEGTFDPIIEASGYSRDALKDAISTVANATEADKTTEAYTNALAIVESFYGTAQGFIDDYAAGKFEETTAEELWVNNSIDNLTDLNEALKNGEISWETYDKMRMSVLKKEADAAGIDWTEVEEYAESL
jgi:ribosomal protein S8